MRDWLVAIDESGIHGAPCFAFGALWLPWDRRGDVSRVLDEARAPSGVDDEIKWSKMSRKTAPSCDRLVRWFFRTSWVSFHAIVVLRADIDRRYHGGDYDVARRKFFNQLIVRGVRKNFEAHGRLPAKYHVWADELPFRYAKAAEAAESIASRLLKRTYGEKAPGLDVREQVSRTCAPIQVCDLLLGALMAARQGEAAAPHKVNIQALIAQHLGWDDLRADTWPSERKFNIWQWTPRPHDSKSRLFTSRSVSLLHPLAARRLNWK